MDEQGMSVMNSLNFHRINSVGVVLNFTRSKVLPLVALDESYKKRETKETNVEKNHLENSSNLS